MSLAPVRSSLGPAELVFLLLEAVKAWPQQNACGAGRKASPAPHQLSGSASPQSTGYHRARLSTGSRHAEASLQAHPSLGNGVASSNG